METKINNNLYSNRILDRAEKQGLFKYGCLKLVDLTEDQKTIFCKTVDHNIEPLLVFWDSVDRWTVMTVDRLFSWYENNLYSCVLEDIKNEIEGVVYEEGKYYEGTKLSINMLYLKRPKIYVWVPKGAALYGFWHVLKYCRPQN